jgi:hypothetical protein
VVESIGGHTNAFASAAPGWKTLFVLLGTAAPDESMFSISRTYCSLPLLPLLVSVIGGMVYIERNNLPNTSGFTTRLFKPPPMHSKTDSIEQRLAWQPREPRMPTLSLDA